MAKVEIKITKNDVMESYVIKEIEEGLLTSFDSIEDLKVCTFVEW